VPLAANQTLYAQGDQVDYVYFPLDAVVSRIAIMEDGTTIETSMIGPESSVGLSTILSSRLSRQWTCVTLSGTAMQLESKFLDTICWQNKAALKALLRCYRSLIMQASQRCVCNTRHTILERLCCWLLMLQDRVGDTCLNLKQEMIASRVGSRRAGIAVAAGMLQNINAIAYPRGQLHIENREKLIAAGCECHHIMQESWSYDPSFLVGKLLSTSTSASKSNGFVM
jgi:CRP-like cAMP-binding protein